MLHNKRNTNSKLLYKNSEKLNDFFFINSKVFMFSSFIRLNINSYIFSIMLYYIFFCGIKINSLNRYILNSCNADYNKLSFYVKLQHSFSKLAVILYLDIVKMCKVTFFNNYVVKFNKFFFKKLLCFNLVSVNRLFLINNNLSRCVYLYYSLGFSYDANNSLNIIRDENSNKKLSKNYFNVLYLCQNLHKKNFVYSNYNLFLLKQYISNFNSFESITMTSISDTKLIVKKFGFFEFFLKKFLENLIQSKICLIFIRNDIDFLLNNQYYLMFVKRIKKLQIFNKDINLVRELVEVLVVTMYTYDVVCFKNWLVKISEKIHFKLHKRLFYIIKIIISKYFNLYFKYFGCLGFCLRVQGKIGLGGSSKTRSFWIKSGQFSLTKKNLKINYTSGHIRTYSGVLGVEVIVSYL